MSKITLKSLKQSRPDHASLIAAVVNQLGGVGSFNDCWQDIVNHGISGGFSGFIYYSDTVEFAKKHQAKILALVEEQAMSMGIDIGEFFSCFNCYKGFTQSEILKAIYSKKGEYADQILNGLAWYAGEEVCRMADSLINE